MSLDWIQIKLRQWGRMSRAIGVGYPSMASHEKARVGRGGTFTGPSYPPDLEEIDLAVSHSPPQHKLILTEHYTKGGDWRDHMARLRYTKTTYFRRKEMAELYLNTLLQNGNDRVASAAR